MSKLLTVLTMVVIILGAMGAALAGMPKMREENTNASIIMELNTEWNAQTPGEKTPPYQPVEENNGHTPTSLDVNTSSYEESSDKPEKARTPQSPGQEARGTDMQENETVRYHRSDSMAIAVPAMTEHKETHIEVNGMEVPVSCYDGTCVVRIPKSAAVHTAEFVQMVLEKVISPRARIVQTAVIERNGFMVAKAVAIEENRTSVMYATADQGAFAVITEIPKDILPDARRVEGNVVVLETDPVLKIYLRSEKNEIAVAGYSIEGDINIVSKDRIEFAICSVRIADTNVRKDGDLYTLSFKVYDGTSPVYVPNIRVMAPGRSVVPQYDEVTQTYSAIMQDVSETKIVATVDGCGEITYYVQPPRREENEAVILATLVLVVILAVGWYLWKG